VALPAITYQDLNYLDFTCTMYVDGVVKDLTGYSSVTLIVRSPVKGTKTYVGSVVGSPVNGVVTYTGFNAANFPGTWTAQFLVTFASGEPLYSQTVSWGEGGNLDGT
jgi:hypothetical protein